MNKARNWIWLVATAMMPLAGCHGLLDVQSPGRIADADLNTKDAIPGIVTGMSYDLARSFNNSE